MKRSKRLVAGFVLMVGVLATGLLVHAQVTRPYRNGSVWQISMIRMKPGMETAYLNYVATDWKRVQESAKKEGLILSYRVLTTEGHGPTDWNMLLMTDTRISRRWKPASKRATPSSRRLSAMTRSRWRDTRNAWRFAR